MITLRTEPDLIWFNAQPLLNNKRKHAESEETQTDRGRNQMNEQLTCPSNETAKMAVGFQLISFQRYSNVSLKIPNDSR